MCLKSYKALSECFAILLTAVNPKRIEFEENKSEILYNLLNFAFVFKHALLLMYKALYESSVITNYYAMKLFSPPKLFCCF